MFATTSRARGESIVEPAGATWRKMVGIALLWVALAALVFTARGEAAYLLPYVAVLGFGCFAAGLSLFAEGLKRSIVAALACAPAPSRFPDS